MGFFHRVANWGRKAIGVAGSVLKKVGQVAAPVIQKIGQFSKPIGAAATALTTALGAPEVGMAINKGLDMLGSSKAAAIAGKIATVGQRMQDVSQKAGG